MYWWSSSCSHFTFQQTLHNNWLGVGRIRLATAIARLLKNKIQWKEFNVHGSVYRNNILIYIQEDATLHSSFYLEIALHVLGDTITHHQERKQLYLQHLVFVRPLLLSAAIAADSSNGVTNTRCYRYSCLRSWWWVMVSPKTCRAISR